MTRFFALLLAVLIPVLAFAGAPDSFIRRNWSESQILTRAAPTLSTEGVSLNEAMSVIFVIDAGSGKTLSGAGALDIWLYDAWDGTNAFWTKFPNRQLAVPSQAP